MPHVLDDARVAKGAILGPYSHLRPGSEIGEDAHVGNFVETKKIRLGKGSKANHLTYLGDAEIGEGVNIGAGTITFNYDGVHMHGFIEGKEIDELNPARDPYQFTAQADHFSHCVQNNLEPNTPGEEGLKDMRLIAEIYRSAGVGA